MNSTSPIYCIHAECKKVEMKNKVLRSNRILVVTLKIPCTNC